MEDNNLSPELVSRDLQTRFIGQKIVYYSVLDSTMEAARREALWGTEAGTVILTDEQNAAHGRFQRPWLSPKGCLALSVILRPNIEYLPTIVMLVSLAVTYSIQVITGLQPQIKWPNDVLINEKKVCGILIENDIRKNSLRHMIVGIGINVNLHLPDYPEISAIATSLSDQLGKEVSRLDLVRQLLVEMDRLYLSLPHTDFIFDQWKKHLVTLGQTVRVNFGNTVSIGVAESVNKDGSLMFRRKDGILVKIVAGEVSLH